MSIADSEGVLVQDARSLKLRSDLKAWEKSFAAAHEGRKANREDIKQHPKIARKYKEYSSLRTQIVSNASTTGTLADYPFPGAKKRKLSCHTQIQQQQQQQQQQLPQIYKPSFQPPLLDQYDQYDHPQSVHTTPTHHRTCVGPTPQKNGKVLGLFDLLSPEDPQADEQAANTPSRQHFIGAQSSTSKRRTRSSAKETGLFATPSKKRQSRDLALLDTHNNSDRHHSRTPLSSSKRAYLDTFLTPSIRRANALQTTPHSRSKDGQCRLFDATPDFLRRESQRTAYPVASRKEDGKIVAQEDVGDDISWSPVTVRMPGLLRPGAGKGLSALVKGLRGLEDEDLDNDMDILRSIEADGETNDGSRLPSNATRTVARDDDVFSREIPPAEPTKPTSNTIVQDSQLPDMPLGPDGAREGDSSSEDEEMAREGLRKDGRPLSKVWKKKGQKRTTKRANMKPVRGKWKPEPKWEAGADAIEREGRREEESGDKRREEGSEDDELVVGETQTGLLDSEGLVAAKSGNGDGRNGKEKEKEKAKAKEMEETGKKRAPRKVSATANANFRALKIRNKNSKGKGGRGGRFGGRRR